MIDFVKYAFNAILLLIGLNLYSQDCSVNISVPDDITICQPTTIALDGNIVGDYLSFEWKGTDDYYNNNNLNPSVNVTQSTTFTLTSYSIPTVNLINNGNFSNGNSGFITDYNYVSNIPFFQFEMYPEGTYTVINNPNLVHNGFAPCTDHTGNGNMMAVNGAASFQQVWCQNITVNPGENYIFQAFATSINPSSPAILQFSINGNLIGAPFNLSGATCDWEEFYATWNSGSNSNVQICVTNQNTAQGGNDFAIDDIFFAPLCKNEKKFTVTLSSFELPEPSNPHLDCSNRNSVLSATPVPDNGLFSYEWATVDGTIEPSVEQESSINVTSSGTYFVTVSDQNGCSRTSQYVVTENFEPTIPKIAGNTGFYCLDESAELMVSASTPVSSYVWLLPDYTTLTGNSITATQGGKYVVTAVGENGCIGADSITLLAFQLGDPLSFNLDCYTPDAVLSAIPFPDNGPFLYNWTTGNGIIETSYDQQSIVVSSAGMYNVTVTDFAGCSRTVQYEVTEDFIPPLPVISGNTVLDCLVKSTELTVTSSNPAASFVWLLPDNTIKTGKKITATIEGKYQVTATGYNGCTGTSSIIVQKEIAGLQHQSYISGVLTCQNKTSDIYLSVTSVVDSIRWQGPGIIFNSQNHDTILVDKAGTYTFTLYLGEDCFASDSVRISEIPDLISYELPIPDTLTCSLKHTEIKLSNPVEIDSISWHFDGWKISDSLAITVEKEGIYYFSVQDRNACMRNDSLHVLSDYNLPFHSAYADTIDCSSHVGGFITQQTNAAIFYWQGQYESSTEKDPVFNSEGNYNLIITGKNGCKDTLQYYLPADLDFPIISESTASITCANSTGNILLKSSVMSVFRWRDEMGNTGEGSNINSTQPGIYTVTATSSKGCESTKIITLDIDTISPKLEIFLLDSLTCAVPVVKPGILAADYKLFYWQGPANENITTLTPLFDVAGIYTLTLQGENGCIRSKSVKVVENKKTPEFDIFYEDLTCKLPTTKLIISGDQDVQYKLDTSQISNNHMITQAGNYKLTGTNHLGCENILNFIVKANFELPVSEIKPVMLNCINKTGLLYNTYIPDVDYQYIWINGNERHYTDSLSVSKAGIVFVEIANQYGCTLKDTITISEDTVIPELSISGFNIIPCDSVFIHLTANPASPEFILYWTDPDGFTDSHLKIQASKVGLYTSHLTNPHNGCSNEKSIDTIKHSPLESYISVLKEPLCPGDMASLNVKQLIGGTAPYNLLINAQSKTIESDFEVSAGFIFIEISDVNGCNLKDTLYVNEPVPFIVDAGDDVLIDLYGTHRIEANVQMNGNQIEQIIWTPAESLSCDDCLTPLATPLEDTNYKITIINQNGCEQEDELLVRVIFNKGYDFPNIISNEGNTGNMYFTIYPIRNSISKLQFLRIYDRWGNMVFNKENFPAGVPEEGWDGNIVGKRVQPGVYVWVSEILYKDGSKELVRGDITILR